jgi:hypothetical protein
MKTETRTERVEFEQEVVEYVCDFQGCEFRTNDKADADRHHGDKHAVKATKKALGKDWDLFESESDFKAHIAAQGPEFGGRWEGSGWYTFIYDQVPCGRGCCQRDEYLAMHATHYRAQLRNEVAAKRAKLTEWRKAFGDK